jgi:hypothetical protein
MTPRMAGLKFTTNDARPAEVLNQSESRDNQYTQETNEWMLDSHAICYGNITF